MQTVFEQISLGASYCSGSPCSSPEAGADPDPFFSFCLAVSCLQSYKEHLSARIHFKCLGQGQALAPVSREQTKYVTE